MTQMKSEVLVKFIGSWTMNHFVVERSKKTGQNDFGFHLGENLRQKMKVQEGFRLQLSTLDVIHELIETCCSLQPHPLLFLPVQYNCDCPWKRE